MNALHNNSTWPKRAQEKQVLILVPPPVYMRINQKFSPCMSSTKWEKGKVHIHANTHKLMTSTVAVLLTRLLSEIFYSSCTVQVTFPSPIGERDGKYFDLYATVLIGLERRRSETMCGRVAEWRDKEIAWPSHPNRNLRRAQQSVQGWRRLRGILNKPVLRQKVNTALKKDTGGSVYDGTLIQAGEGKQMRRLSLKDTTMNLRLYTTLKPSTAVSNSAEKLFMNHCTQFVHKHRANSLSLCNLPVFVWLTHESCTKSCARSNFVKTFFCLTLEWGH